MNQFHDKKSTASSYEAVPVDDEESLVMENVSLVTEKSSNSLNLPWKNCLKASKSLMVSVVLCLIILVAVSIVAFTTHTGVSRPYLNSTSSALPQEPSLTEGCGKFPSDGIENGCVWDTMNYGYTPRACHYHALAEEFYAKGPWKWWLDPNGTIEIEQNEYVLRRSIEVWTEASWHMEHCRYTQRILAMAEENDDLLVPWKLAQPEHTAHCKKMIEEISAMPDLTVLDTWVRMLFTPCVRLSEVKARRSQ